MQIAKLTSTIATIVLVAAVVDLAVRKGLIGSGPISISLQIAAILLVLWARLTFGFRSLHFAANPIRGPLITSGPYHYVRNPIYAAAWLFVWTGIAVHWSRANALLGLVAAAMLVVKIICEEKLLREAYVEYNDYARKTPRLIPFLF
jgi:protein-S-isoprenylcysteine O-methyltransferase Ste14